MRAIRLAANAASLERGVSPQGPLLSPKAVTESAPAAVTYDAVPDHPLPD